MADKFKTDELKNIRKYVRQFIWKKEHTKHQAHAL